MISSRKVLTLLLSSLLMIISFFTSAQSDKEAQSIINKSIKVHGGKKVANGHFSFDFRKHHFTYKRNNGEFEYSRTNKETGVKDILTNGGLVRIEDERKVELSEKQKRSYARSVNSVHYFAFLPYFLNDNAVIKEFIGETQIKGKDYYKIKVTFDQEGGGDDYDDVYIYWIDQEEYTLDYLAYSFHVDGGGVRFREAYNTRKVKGVIFQDYINYKHDKETPVEKLDSFYENNELTELSRIELLNVKSL